MSDARTSMTRTVIPAAIIWSSLLLSAWVHATHIGPGPQRSPLLLAAMLFAAPVVGMLLWLTVRISTRKAVGGPQSQEGTDLVVIWILSFLFTLHAATLATLIGLLGGLIRPASGATAILLVGLGFLLRGLEHQSPVGIRTKGTMADLGAWSRAHRALSVGLFSAGLVATIGTGLDDPRWIAAAVGVAAISLVVAGIVGRAPPPVNSGPPPTVEEKKAPSSEEAP